jgi:hypothetical protein
VRANWKHVTVKEAQMLYLILKNSARFIKRMLLK